MSSQTQKLHKMSPPPPVANRIVPRNGRWNGRWNGHRNGFRDHIIAMNPINLNFLRDPLRFVNNNLNIEINMAPVRLHGDALRHV